MHVGAGAMGEVYRGRDTRLGRTVAIKVLPLSVGDDQTLRERFEREARAVSSLSHPHICTLYDIGQERPRSPDAAGGTRNESASTDTADPISFLVMEFLEGQTLADRIAAGPVPVAEAVDRAIEIADALDCAHRRHLVHRDLKPSNVMITEAGAKLLDFGLVKRAAALDGAAPADATRTLEVTQPGLIVGTISYMSPEQARGQEVDGRTDVFSLGVVLYELVTGRKPFQGQTPLDVVGAILGAEPLALQSSTTSLPPELESAIQRALRKEMAARYASAAAMLEDLRAVQRRLTGAEGSGSTSTNAASGRPKRPRRGRKRIDSLAVLPLANASDDAAAEYLSDGVTESIINSLSAIPTLRVMARSTVFRYKGQTVDASRSGKSWTCGQS